MVPLVDPLLHRLLALDFTIPGKALGSWLLGVGLLGGTPGILKVFLGVEVLASCGVLLEEP